MKKGTLCGQEQGPPDHEIGQLLGSWTHPKISKCWGNGERSFEGWIRQRARETVRPGLEWVWNWGLPTPPTSPVSVEWTFEP